MLTSIFYFDYLLKSETIHNNIIAPTVDIIRVPNMPFQLSPRSVNTHPPKTPPTIPTIRFRTTPIPRPFIILEAMKPAKIPIIIDQIIPITL